MKRLFLILLFFASYLNAQTYYVTTTGSGTTCSEVSPCTLTYAFANAVAGDTWYVKAGNYGALDLASSSAGTSGSPIKFIGYTSTINDILATSGPTYTYSDWLANSSDLPDNIMPHLELNPVNDNPASTDRAFEINHSYIEMHNFMVSEYEYGWNIEASNVTLNNCIGDQFGEWDPTNPDWNANGYKPGLATGYAVRLSGSDNSFIKNCLMIDAGMVDYFIISSDNVTLTDNVGIAENTGNGSDYIFDFYSSTNCTINDNFAQKTYFNDNIGHQSRCLIFQEESTGNIVNTFTSIGVKLQLEDSNWNIINDLTMTSSGGTSDQMGSVQIGGQADNNIINNLSITGAGGIQFHGWTAGMESPSTPQVSAGENNYFINVDLSDLAYPISFHRLSGDNGLTAGTNYIVNISVDNADYFINANRPGTINIYNSTFSNINNWDTFYPGWADYRTSVTATFEDCNFENSTNGFGDPTDEPRGTLTFTRLVNANPFFTDDTTGDFHLTASSTGLIDAGQDASNITYNTITGTPAGMVTAFNAAVILDFDGNTRPYNTNWDIGSYEYGAGAAETCSDGIQNQDETGVDCGGVCPPCAATSKRATIKGAKIEGSKIYITN